MNVNRPHNEAERGIRPIVVSRAKVNTLRNANMVPEVHQRKIIDPAVLADPAMVADAEQPRILHADSWLDYYSRSDLGSEQTEKPAAKRGSGKRLASQ
jgi:hypothetical protein